MASGAPANPAGGTDDDFERRKALTRDKGKEKIMPVRKGGEGGGGEGGGGEEAEAAAVEGNGVTCGICLAEDERAVRGVIDGCGHCFCFVCLLEWARVESRCPLCKSRFSSVRRLPKRGVFDGERVVPVPVRDQAYHFLEITTIESSNPNAEISCFECHRSKDENLLLVCDLCDLAAHTYCVGLGYTVPEGDWYCHDCSLSRDDYLICRSSMESDNGDTSKIRLVEAHVPEADIVRDEGDTDNLPGADSSNQGSESRRRNGCSRSNTIVNEESSFSYDMIPKPHCSRALYNRRYLLERVKTLRENWNAIQRGEMTFSSTIDVTVSRSRPRKSCTSSESKRNPQTNLTSSKFSSKDVHQAWKMLEIAKKAQRLQARSVEDNDARGKMGRRILQETSRGVEMKKRPLGQMDLSTTTSYNGSTQRTLQVLRTNKRKCPTKRNQD